MDKIRIGVVGVGYLGRIHARIYSHMPQVVLVGVVDSNAQTAKGVAAEFGCKAYTHIEALIDQVDAVSIAVPTSMHLEVTRPFLERGIHVLVEKPLTATYAEGVEMLHLAEANHSILQVGHLERFNAGVMALADHAHEPRFIEIHRLGPFANRATDVDVVTDLMIHDIDIVMALIDSKLTDIKAVGTHVLTDHVDIANARLQFENGAVANVTASRVSTKKFRRIRVFSEHHYYGLDYIDQKLEMITASHSSEEPRIVREEVHIKPRPPLDVELEHFVDVVQHDGKPLVDGRAGLEAVRVAALVKKEIYSCLKEKETSLS